MLCWKCNKKMKKVQDKFHGFEIIASKCPKCSEIIYDEKEIQPILKYNKLKQKTIKVGELGNSKIFRFPKVAEQIYGITKGTQLLFELKPNEITIRLKG